MKSVCFFLPILFILSGCNQNGSCGECVCRDGKPVFEEKELKNGAKRLAEFKIDQYLPYMKKGKGRIKGRLCVSTNDGEKCLSNQLVLLNPVTDYSTEWYKRYWKKDEFLEEPNGAASARSQLIQTGKSGEFIFSRLPYGDYYVAAVACPYSKNRKKEKAGFNYQRWSAKVSVKSRKTVNVVLEKDLEYKD